MSSSESSESSRREKECTSKARSTLINTFIGFGLGFGGLILLGNNFSPYFKNKIGWRAKVLTSCISTLALSYYRAEVSLTECSTKQKWEDFARFQQKEKEKQLIKR